VRPPLYAAPGHLVSMPLYGCMAFVCSTICHLILDSTVINMIEVGYALRYKGSRYGCVQACGLIFMEC
jgi:hypothetical protein